MADATKKQVIIDVKVERDKRIEQLLDQMVGLRKEIDAIDREMDSLNTAFKAGDRTLYQYIETSTKLTAERKAATKQLQSLSREEQNLVVANTATKNSLNALRAEYNALKVQIANLDVDGTEFAQMSAQMDTLVKKINKAEQSYGVFSRNVGNYASGFSPLSFQIQQLARELPSLTIGLPQFFLAISNNLPMLGDAIAQTKAEIASAKAEGKEVVPIGKQIVKSIFSWQTALVAVITILSVFGKEITQFIGGLFKGKEAIDAFRKSASEMVGSVAQERAELAALFNALALAEEGTANYVAVRNTILDKYGDLLESEREEVKNLTAIGEAYDVIAKKITGKAIAEGFASQIEEQSKQIGESYQEWFDKLYPDFEKFLGADGQSALVGFLTGLVEGDRAAAFNALGDNTDILSTLFRGRGVGGIKGSYLAQIEDDFKQLNDQIKATTEAQATFMKLYNAEAPNVKKSSETSNDDAYNRAKRTLELEQAIEVERLNSQEQYQYDSTLSAEENDALEFARQTKHNREMFELEQRHKEELLKLDEQYDKISTEEAAATRRLYAQETITFNAEQLAETNEFLRKQSDAILKEADKLRKEVLKANEETEISATRSKWADYRTALGRNSEISSTEQADLVALSIDQEEAEILAIRRKYRQAERRLEQEHARALREEYDDRLALAWKDADSQYDITEKMLNEQLLLYKDNAIERAKIERELFENEMARQNARIDKWVEYASQVGNLLGGVNELAQSIYAGQLAAEEANNEEAQKSLEKRLAAGLISERKYNQEKTNLEEDFAKKQAEIQRKQAIFERSLAIFNIGVQTAEGVIRALVANAANPVRGGILAGLITASGVAQTAAVLAEPLPMAREGGLVVGPTHEQGGVVANLEGGEQIIAKNPVKVFPELLNLISYIGKHAHIPQSGYAFRGIANSEATAEQIGRKVGQTIARQSEEQAQIIGAEVGREVAKELRNLEVVTTVEAFEKAKREYDRVINSAKS